MVGGSLPCSGHVRFSLRARVGCRGRPPSAEQLAVFASVRTSRSEETATSVRVIVTGVLVGLVLFAWPGRAQALIEPEKASIAGVRLDMSADEVRAMKGPPSRVLRVRTEFGVRREYRYSRQGLRVWLDRTTSKVETVLTTSPRERTRSGVGVGSTVPQARTYLRPSRCGRSPDFGWFCTTIPPRPRAAVLVVGFRCNRARILAVDRVRPIGLAGNALAAPACQVP
jgi:hypothetical protein